MDCEKFRYTKLFFVRSVKSQAYVLAFYEIIRAADDF